MSDNSELLALAERCEQAMGPDRKLEIEIGHIAHPNAMITREYTASLDAALTLVPEGFVTNLGNDTGAAWAHVWSDGPDYDGMIPGSRAVTMPLALCAAALRSRATDKGEVQNG